VLKDGGSRSSKGGYNDMGRVSLSRFSILSILCTVILILNEQNIQTKAEGEEEEDNESEYDGDSEDHLEDDIADESDAESLIESMFNDSDPDP